MKSQEEILEHQLLDIGIQVFESDKITKESMFWLKVKSLSQTEKIWHFK